MPALSKLTIVFFSLATSGQQSDVEEDGEDGDGEGESGEDGEGEEYRKTIMIGES